MTSSATGSVEIDLTPGSASINDKEEEEECCICVEKALHPIKLPCKHIFCFLCIKGVIANAAQKSEQNCPLCRTPIPQKAIDSPEVITPKTSKKRKSDSVRNSGKKAKLTKTDSTSATDSGPACTSTTNDQVWFYEGRNGGWWQYDERTNGILDNAVSEGKSSIELMLAGHIYVLDLDAKVQTRKDDPSIKRMMKKDLKTSSAKGIAGLKIK